MALQVCPDCGRQVSTAAAACPNCGWRRTRTERLKHWAGPAAWVCVLGFGLPLMFYFWRSGNKLGAVLALLSIFIAFFLFIALLLQAGVLN